MERVGRYWAGIFGPDAGSRVAEHGVALAGYRGVYVVVRGDMVMISAPPELVSTIHGWRATPGEALDVDWWRERLPDGEVVGPSVHAFLTRQPPHHPTDGVVTTSIEEATTQLRPVVPEAEWDEAGFADEVAQVWSVSVAGTMVAAARLAMFDGVAADLGVIVRSDRRGRGHGRDVAAVAASFAVDRHGIARWRSLTANVPSRSLGRSLGFRDDAVQLAVRLRGDGQTG